MENLFTIKTDSITAINETFRFFYPNEEPPKPTSLSFHLSTVMMHLAVVESKKFAVAVGVMKAIPNLNPENAATWLAKLPFKVISELWNSNDKIYTAVKNAINNIPNESFVKTAQVQDFYSIGQVSAEKLDHDS